MNRTPQLTREAAALHLDANLRMASARRVLDAYLTGEWIPEPAELDQLGILIRQAGRRIALADELDLAA